MDYNLQIQKIMVKVEQHDLPDDKIKLLKEAVSLADAHNDLEWGFDLRTEIMEEEFYTPHDNESFAAFAWLLEACDQHPDLFDEDELLWKYKWMASAARNNSGISIEQFNTIMADFKIRMERNGYSLRAYYTQLHCMELFQMRNLEKAKELLGMRNKAQRDDMADCRACELDDDISMEIALGNIDKALEMSNDLFSGKLSCAHVPFITYCSFLGYFHENKNMEKAEEIFNKAEANLLEMENDSSQIGNIGTMINFLNDYNKERAWEYFEKYIHWSLECDEKSKLDISTYVLPLLKSNGTRVLQVNSAMPWYRPEGNYNIPDLYDYYLAQATDLAQRFDARNGNDFFMKDVEKLK